MSGLVDQCWLNPAAFNRSRRAHNPSNRVANQHLSVVSPSKRVANPHLFIVSQSSRAVLLRAMVAVVTDDQGVVEDVDAAGSAWREVLVSSKATAGHGCLPFFIARRNPSTPRASSRIHCSILIASWAVLDRMLPP